MQTVETDCAICLQTLQHPTALPCGHVFCFLCSKGEVLRRKRCALCRTVIPPEYFYEPKLLDGSEDGTKTVLEKPPDALDDGFQWFYEGRNGWWLYDKRTCLDIEQHYKDNKDSAEVLVAGSLYTINFKLMRQYRQNTPNRYRRIKRDLSTAEVKGVAGIKLKNAQQNSEVLTKRPEAEGDENDKSDQAQGNSPPLKAPDPNYVVIPKHSRSDDTTNFDAHRIDSMDRNSNSAESDIPSIHPARITVSPIYNPSTERQAHSIPQHIQGRSSTEDPPKKLVSTSNIPFSELNTTANLTVRNRNKTPHAAEDNNASALDSAARREARSHESQDTPHLSPRTELSHHLTDMSFDSNRNLPNSKKDNSVSVRDMHRNATQVSAEHSYASPETRRRVRPRSSPDESPVTEITYV